MQIESPGPSASSSGMSKDKESNSAIMRKRKQVENLTEKKHQEKLRRFDEFLKLYRASVEHQIGKKVE